jgi:dipeptidyl aminopeptidase/acylaminoacyl peptidase
VAAKWVTDRPHVTYFDPSLERVHAAVSKALAGKAIVIADESWDRNVYLVFAYSDVDPGAWYRLDLKARQLDLIESYRPALRGMELSAMDSISHEAADGARVPGYVTRPIGAPEGPAPTIVMPHGGPESRDVWGFDWLAQYLAASGYVVLQTNFRGSFGYGDDWLGDGGFQSWRRVVSDIDAGLQHLIDEGITDPKRVCAMGWSFGGYASLMSVIEHPERYRCVVDIAGVADPGMLIDQYDDFLNEDFVEAFISRSDDVLYAGSAIKRAKEIAVPVLIFHGDEDLNVDVDQGRKLAKALRKADKPVDYVEYEDDEHGLWRHASRIDMLKRIGRFLDANLDGPSRAEGAAEAGAGGDDGSDAAVAQQSAPVHR